MARPRPARPRCWQGARAEMASCCSAAGPGAVFRATHFSFEPPSCGLRRPRQLSAQWARCRFAVSFAVFGKSTSSFSPENQIYCECRGGDWAMSLPITAVCTRRYPELHFTCQCHKSQCPLPCRCHTTLQHRTLWSEERRVRCNKQSLAQQWSDLACLSLTSNYHHCTARTCVLCDESAVTL